MFAAFNAFRSSVTAPRLVEAPVEFPSGMLFEVQLVDSDTDFDEPLTVFTKQPLEVAGELLRDRDPNKWDVRIRALAMGERPV